MPRDLPHPLGDVASDEADNDGTDKSGIEAGLCATGACCCQVGKLCAAIGDETGDHTDDKTRTVSNGLGDETGEYRDHEGEGQRANLQDSLPETVLRNGDATSSGFTTDAQSQSNHDAAADHKRDHVGHASHEGGVQGVTNGLLAILTGRGSSRFGGWLVGRFGSPSAPTGRSG